MKKVKDLLSTKGSSVLTITPDETVFNALKVMTENDIGALVVLEGDRVCGVISERDFVRKVVLKSKILKTTPVKEIMSRADSTVNPEHTVEECMSIMTAKRVRHLPVLESEKLFGIISIGDLVKSIITEQEFLIKNLEDYIGGSPSVR